MAQILKIDFSKEAKELRIMKKERSDEKRVPLTEIEKIGYVFHKQAGIKH